jgi:hypothetical protein
MLRLTPRNPVSMENSSFEVMAFTKKPGFCLECNNLLVPKHQPRERDKS